VKDVASSFQPNVPSDRERDRTARHDCSTTQGAVGFVPEKYVRGSTGPVLKKIDGRWIVTSFVMDA